MRSVPLTYAELADAIRAGVFPHERHWIDFKRRLYPEEPAAGQPSQATRDKVNAELARDMASMAERGGFFIYGLRRTRPATRSWLTRSVLSQRFLARLATTAIGSSA